MSWTQHVVPVLLRALQIRDRLRCPKCRAVGTWKPHGDVLDFEDVRCVVRWLCKWCGYYRGPEGERWATLGSKSWELPDHGTNPLLTCDTPQKRCGSADPWQG